MLNELLSFCDSLESWGISPEQDGEQWHRELKSNPNQKAIEVRIGPKGIVEINDFDAWRNLRFYKKSNKAIGLSFGPKKDEDEEKKLERIKARIQTTIEISKEVFDGSEELLALKQLAEHLEKIDVNAFIEQLSEYYQDKPLHVALEVDKPSDYPCPVQSFTCLRKISQRLFELEDGQLESPQADDEKKDILGNSNFGSDKKGFEVKPGNIQIQYFSKFEKNQCFERFGLNSTQSCVLGITSRRKIERAIDFILSPEHQAYYDKKNKREVGGLWYSVSVTNIDGKVMKSHWVLSSILPNQTTLESKSEVTLEDWQESAASLIKMMREQKKRDVVGRIVVLELVGQKKVGRVVYSKSATSEEILNGVNEWKAGIQNGRSIFQVAYPNLRNVVDACNCTWNYNGAEDKFTSVKSYGFNIWDAHDLFFNEPAAIAKFERHYATHVAPMVFRCNYKNAPYLLRHLLPLGHLILYKKGLKMEDYENHWAFLLGRLLTEASAIHRAFFMCRGASVPSTLIGGKSLYGIRSNPDSGMDSFVRNFNVYLDWAKNYKRKESDNCYFSVRIYEELLSRMTEAAHGQLPTSLSHQASLLLAAGYSYRKPQENGE